MAYASFYDLFLRLPPSAAFLFLASILGTTDGHALPRQTKTVELHELNVVPWPLLPTEAPIAPLDLLRRQENTICGYIGGDSNLPATCGAGSHCVVDVENSVVGCCPNGGACSTGVFTSCVDGGSPPQTEANPYVYTCQGADSCYQNTYAGDFFQWGCGTSDLATNVQTSVEGITTTLDLPTTSIELTQTPSSLSEPTTIGSGTRSTTTSSPTSSITSSTLSSSTTTSSGSTSTNSGTSSSTASGGPTEAPPTDGGSGNSRTGAIVGGTLGAVAGLFVLAGLAFFLLRRRQNNPREGPGPAPPAPPTTEYSSPIRSHGAAFAPLPSWQEDRGNGYSSPYDRQQDSGLFDNEGSENYNTVPIVPPPQRYDPAHVAGVGTGLAPVEEEDSYHQHQHHEPAAAAAAARDIDDFSRAYSDARIGQISDDDTRPLTGPDDVASPEPSYPETPPGPIRGGNRPLWQQNRQRSRNLMWM